MKPIDPNNAALWASDQRFRDLVDSTGGIVWEADALTYNNTFVSTSVERLLGYSVADWFTTDFWTNHIDPADREAVTAYSARQTALAQDHEMEYRFLAKGGHSVWLHDTTKIICEDGKPRWLRGLLVDISVRKAAEQQLRESQAALRDSEQRYKALVEWSPDAVGVHRAGLMVYVNPAAVRLMGAPSAQVLLGRSMLDFVHPDFRDAVIARAAASQLEGASAPMMEEKFLRLDGSAVDVEVQSSAIRYDGAPATLVVIRDITQRRHHEDEIRRLAFYDPLTLLPNRRLLMDRLKQAITTSDRSNQHGAVMFLDLDHFKQLNDTLGHDVGDLLLQQVATRLSGCVREGDSVARLGGDEFVVLLESLSTLPHEAATQSEVIATKIIAALGQPYILRDHVYTSTPSIGIVVFLEAHETIDEVLKKADVAMYQAKAAGRNTARFFDPAMQAIAAAHTELEKDMRLGLARQEFVLHYQIQVNVHGATTGVEALVRWKHPTRGMVSPADFIPMAEETGLILPLGQWVLETACAQLFAWAKSPLTAHWTVAVNVSAAQFAQAGFVNHIATALAHTGATARLLKLEMTESMLMDNVEDVIAKMNAVKAQGVRLSLDDFGTGYSSLSYLKRLPLDQLKIDQSFVRDLLTDPNDAVIARTIVALGHSLGLNIIAEGVESLEQRNFLAGLGCDAFQGYYFGRPVAAQALVAEAPPY